jgi:hypothetical protein
MTDDELLQAIDAGMQTVAERFRAKRDPSAPNSPSPPAAASHPPEAAPNTRAKQAVG